MTDLTPQMPLSARSVGAAAAGGDVLKEIWRGRWLVLLVTILALGLGALYAYRLAGPVYRTHTTLMIEAQRTEVIGVESVLSALTRESQVLNTQVEVLRSRRLLSALVGSLNLARDPEFNPGLRNDDSLRGQARRWLEERGLIRPVANPFLRPDAAEAATVNALMRKLEISVEPETLVITIALGSRDAAKSARIVNELASLYVADQLARKQAATDEASAWLASRVAGIEADLRRAEARSAAWKAENGHVSEPRLADLERQLEAAKAQPAPQAATVARLTDQIAAMSADLALGRQFDREADAIRVQYRMFEARLKETSLLDGSLSADARILSPAIVPLFPAAPKPTLILGLALIAGLTLGTALAAARSQLRLTYPTRTAMEADAGMPILAAAALGDTAMAELAATRLAARLEGMSRTDIALCAAPGMGSAAEWLSQLLSQNSGLEVLRDIERPLALSPPRLVLLVVSDRTRVGALRRTLSSLRLWFGGRIGLVVVSPRKRLPHSWRLST